MAKGKGPRLTRSHWKAPNGEEYPIRDAHPDAEILITVTQGDIAKATKLDPNHCALAQAWMRQAHVAVAQIGIDKAYLLMRDKGKLYALRCKTDKATKDKIDHFDRTGELPDDGFWLYGIPKSEGINSQRAQAKRHRDRWGTMGAQTKTKRQTLHLRNASRRAQTYRA